MFASTVTESEVITYLKINKSNASGFDGVSPAVIKLCIHSISKPLCHCINIAFKTGVFPTSLKVAKLVPVYKKGDKSTIKNW